VRVNPSALDRVNPSFVELQNVIDNHDGVPDYASTDLNQGEPDVYLSIAIYTYITYVCVN